jgi:DNA polymerase-3 subunit delta'
VVHYLWLLPAQYILWKTGMVKIMVKICCNLKFQKLSHPDLLYPTVSTESVKTKPKALILLQIGAFTTQNPYGGLFDWYAVLVFKISKEKLELMMHRNFKIISLKSYEGGYKIMIIWMADKLNIASKIKN